MAKPGLNLLRGLGVTSVLQDVFIIDVICCSEENDGTLIKIADPPFQHVQETHGRCGLLIVKFLTEAVRRRVENMPWLCLNQVDGKHQ